jgi:hypothetical protein
LAISDKARTAFGLGINFNLNADLLPVDSLTPADGNNNTNCLNFVLWAAGLDYRNYTYPRIDDMIDKLPRLLSPSVNNFIASPSVPAGSFSWQKAIPGCIAIISEVTNNTVSKIIIAHPKVIGIIGEVPPYIFQNKPSVYLGVS